jgi:predicted DNA-binding protein
LSFCLSPSRQRWIQYSTLYSTLPSNSLVNVLTDLARFLDTLPEGYGEAEVDVDQAETQTNDSSSQTSTRARTTSVRERVEGYLNALEVMRLQSESLENEDEEDEDKHRHQQEYRKLAEEVGRWVEGYIEYVPSFA